METMIGYARTAGDNYRVEKERYSYEYELNSLLLQEIKEIGDGVFTAEGFSTYDEPEFVNVKFYIPELDPKHYKESELDEYGEPQGGWEALQNKLIPEVDEGWEKYIVEIR